MSAVYLLVPLSILLVGVIIYFFFWAVRNDQFSDLDGPAHRILFDDDEQIGEAGRMDDRVGDDARTDKELLD